MLWPAYSLSWQEESKNPILFLSTFWPRHAPILIPLQKTIALDTNEEYGTVPCLLSSLTLGAPLKTQCRVNEGMAAPSQGWMQKEGGKKKKSGAAE